MDNVSKALMMAGTVLISVVVISLIVMTFRNISDFYKGEADNLTEEQIYEFNKSYSSYEKDLYGSEILSIINKIQDYNEKYESEGYESIVLNFEVKTEISTGFSNNDIKILPATYSTKHNGITKEIPEILSNREMIKNIEQTYKGDKYLQRLLRLYELNKENEINILFEEIFGQNSSHKFDNVVDKKNMNAYSLYIDFKRRKFKWVNTERAENGRMKEIRYREI